MGEKNSKWTVKEAMDWLENHGHTVKEGWVILTPPRNSLRSLARADFLAKHHMQVRYPTYPARAG